MTISVYQRLLAVKSISPFAADNDARGQGRGRRQGCNPDESATASHVSAGDGGTLASPFNFAPLRLGRVPLR